MFKYAVEEHNGPIAIRYPKGREELSGRAGFKFGKARVVSAGKDITLCAEGIMLKTALDAAGKAENAGFKVEVIELSTIYPTDFETIEKSVKKTGRLITLEANALRGGMGEEIFARLKCPGKAISFPDVFIEHGKTKTRTERYGLDSDSVAESILKLCGGQNEA